MRRAALFSLVCAGFGFAVALFLAGPPSAIISPALQSVVALLLCPPGLLVALSAIDPDAAVIWLILAPLNAVLYGALGFLAWWKLAASADPS